LTAQFRWGSPDPDKRVQALHGVEYRQYEETGHMCTGSHIKLLQMAVPAATPSYAERCVVQVRSTHHLLCSGIGVPCRQLPGEQVAVGRRPR
jgi:hypothetical protein